ncbi:MAG: hypothetical protein AAF288_12540 [Planctomycetota bacterium]
MTLSEQLAAEAMRQSLTMLRQLADDASLDDRVRVINTAKQVLDKLDRETIAREVLGDTL